MAETHEAEKTGFTISSSTCKRYFGYLSEREKGAAMPDDCLTCSKMIDCMFSKGGGHSTPRNSAPPPSSNEPEMEMQKAVEEQIDTEETVNEVDEPVIFNKPNVVNAQLEEERMEEPKRLEIWRPIEPEKAIAKPVVRRADDEFVVETPGHMYNQWSSTVLLNKEMLESLGKNVKEVYVQTRDGLRVKCKVYTIPEIRSRAIQIPDKLKTDLEITDGDYVKVTPK